MFIKTKNEKPKRRNYLRPDQIEVHDFAKASRYFSTDIDDKDLYEDMDKYFEIVSKEKVVVEIEDNKNIIILPEEEYMKLKCLGGEQNEWFYNNSRRIKG